MKKRHFIPLWAMFVGFTFMVLLTTLILMVSIAFLLFHFGLLNMEQDNPLGPITILLILSAIVGATLFLFVGRIFVNPIRRFSVVSKEVAKGNFDVKIDDDSKIAEVQEMAANFNVMVQELSSIETLQTDFVVNVSHEFKTPLAAIEGYATLLQEKGLSDSDRDECIRMIIDSVRQLSVLTGNILSLSKLENQEIVLDKKAFRLDEQIRETVLLLESKWSEKDIELVVDLAKANYVGNKNLLRHVWLNLLENAVKFTPENGCIEIRLLSNGDYITVKVKDSGKGIDGADIKHIFDKFYQADRARKQAGNGLGLALVKRIVDLCGGSVEVVSEPGVGSEFTVMLPNNEDAT